ncbi:MAG: transporter substrate-binding domain-containing protein [Desulfobacteraceae bacterium]|nr:transporter substrate-binding domain-containing protein [Desulfobacteraceae bacterium]
MYSSKKFTTYVISILICIFVSAPVFGETLQVVTEEYPPYNYTEKGKITGFCTDVVRETLKRANLEHSIQSHSWAESYQKALAEPNVLIYSMGRNVEREPLFKWVDIIARTEVYFYKLRSRPSIKIKTFDDVRKYKIGAVQDDFRVQWLMKQGIKEQLTLVADDRQNMRNLFERKIDIFPIGEFVAYKIAHQEGRAFNNLEKTMYVKDMSPDLYMAFSKQTPDIMLEKCKKALFEIRKDGTYEKIKSKYAIFYLPIFKISSY